jgi:hypothetical protein
LIVKLDCDTIFSLSTLGGNLVELIDFSILSGGNEEFAKMNSVCELHELFVAVLILRSVVVNP